MSEKFKEDLQRFEWIRLIELADSKETISNILLCALRLNSEETDPFPHNAKMIVECAIRRAFECGFEIGTLSTQTRVKQILGL